MVLSTKVNASDQQPLAAISKADVVSPWNESAFFQTLKKHLESRS
jgi:hypothetical protein